MNYTISYYNERIRQQVMLLPPGILADYIHLTDLKLARKRLKEVKNG